MAGTVSLIQPVSSGNSGTPPGEGPYQNLDGLDAILAQVPLQNVMEQTQNAMINIENNSNLSDVEKMFSMQMAINTWTAVSTLRTNLVKSVGDACKGVCQNIGQ